MCRTVLVAVAGIVLAGALAGCTPKTRDAEVVHGLASAPAHQLVTIREANKVYVAKIDSRRIRDEPNLSVKVKTPLNFMDGEWDYRQYQISPGRHELAVFFRMGDGASSAMSVPPARESEMNRFTTSVVLEPGKTYFLQADMDDVYLTLGNMAMTSLGIDVIDAANGNPVAHLGGRPATRPVVPSTWVPPEEAKAAALSQWTPSTQATGTWGPGAYRGGGATTRWVVPGQDSDRPATRWVR